MEPKERKSYTADGSYVAFGEQREWRPKVLSTPKHEISRNGVKIKLHAGHRMVCSPYFDLKTCCNVLHLSPSVLVLGQNNCVFCYRTSPVVSGCNVQLRASRSSVGSALILEARLRVYRSTS